MADPARALSAWHALPADDVLARLEATTEGLADEEAARRRAAGHDNSLALSKPPSALRVLADQLRSVVVLLLVAAAAVAAAAGDAVEAVAIALVLLLNTAIGFASEWRARQSIEALRQLELQRATVRRGGRTARIDARALVPGDVVELEAGESVAADLRVLSAAELLANEAPLTGESLPVAKSAAPVDESAPLPERSSLLYKGTLVSAGSAVGVVVATGPDTEIGRIGRLVTETREERTPLERRLDQLGRRLVLATLVVAAAVAAIGLARGQEPWLMARTAIALAVAAVPEGLPVVAVIALAVGMHRMAKRNAIVRKPAAVEALGSATVVCTDKTGTLTAGEMTVRALALGGAEYAVRGHGYAVDGAIERDGETVTAADDARLARAVAVGALANRAGLERTEDGAVHAHGDPTEAALLVLAQKAGAPREEWLAAEPEVGHVPFSSERMWMATFHRTADGGARAAVKGAAARILPACARVLGANGERAMEDADRARALATNDALAARGLRVLGLAERRFAPGVEPGTELAELVWLGCVGIADPPAPGVRPTVDALTSAGVRTLMITGDQRLTARAVADEIGILREGDEVVDGAALEELSDDDLAQRLPRIAAVSRASPEQKLRIVRVLRAHGEVVGMLGDGINDAAALKGADIGVAMGKRGTDVAKETADIVLVDDRFETVGAAVREGRVVFDNIRKFTYFLFSSNLSEVLFLLVSGLVGLPLPLLPLQILWLNLVTDVFPALALAVEPAEPDVMRRPPRDPARAILSGAFLRAVAIDAVLLTAPVLAVHALAGPERGYALPFLALGLAQLAHAVACKSPRPVLFSRRALENRWLWLGIALSAALLGAAVSVPVLSGALGLSAPSAREVGIAVGAALLSLGAGQALRARRHADPAGP